MNRTALAAFGLLALTACASGSSVPKQPAESAFADGTCRTAAPDVLEIGRDARHLGKGPGLPSRVDDSITKAQTHLRPITDGAEPSYRPALQKLVTAVGLVRLRAHVGSYSPSLGRDVTSAYDGVLAVCTKAAQ